MLILLDFWPCDHVVHREIFKHDHLEGINQDSSLLMMEVFPLIANFLVCFGYQFDGLSPSVALLLFPRKTLLLLLQPTMGLPKEPWVIYHIAVRVGHEVLEPHVNADGEVGVGKLLSLLYFTGEDSIP